MPTSLAIAETIRRACLEAALNAYEDAGVQGLCEAGRWEAAVGAIESLDLRQLMLALAADDAQSSAGKRPLG